MDDLNELRDRLSALEKRVNEVDTQVDAAEQALAAFTVAQKSREKIDSIGDRLELLIRSVNAIACVFCGALLLWFGNSLAIDASTLNDRIADWLILGGGGCIGYGLLVLTGNEQQVLSWIEQINPFRR